MAIQVGSYTERQEQNFLIHNEFASVEVVRDVRANGDRLTIRDLRTSRTISLDALELERLAHASHDDLSDIVTSQAVELRAELHHL